MFIRYGRKIWLTEFAVANTHDKQKVIDFVKVSVLFDYLLWYLKIVLRE